MRSLLLQKARRKAQSAFSKLYILVNFIQCPGRQQRAEVGSIMFNATEWQFGDAPGAFGPHLRWLRARFGGQRVTVPVMR